jgi:protein-L-isoaspartate(D-aspartate) O-methyltransferase
VVSIDVQPDVVDDARAALDAAGIEGVTVLLGDGYDGAADGGPYDRIIVTVGVGGVPPGWLDQLIPGGLIVAPIEHGGIQPCVAISCGPEGLTGRGAAASGFMLAAGRLHPDARVPEPLVIDEPLPLVPIQPIPDRRYYDLWFGLAATDRRIARRPVPGYDDDGVQCVLSDPGSGSVLIQRDGLLPIGATTALVDHTRLLVERWHAAGAPPVTAWRCGFRATGDLWVPATWHLP